jgi:hypothetical protein
MIMPFLLFSEGGPSPVNESHCTPPPFPHLGPCSGGCVDHTVRPLLGCEAQEACLSDEGQRVAVYSAQGAAPAGSTSRPGMHRVLLVSLMVFAELC